MQTHRKSAAATLRRPPARRPRQSVKQRIEAALRREFPTDTVDVSDGYRDNIHVLVVSRRYDTMHEREKFDFLWKAIDSAGLTQRESSRISLVLPLSPADIK